MSQFMLALLNDGGGILQPQTVKQMFSTLYRMEPNVSGYAYGWMEQDRGGERIMGHGGDMAFSTRFCCWCLNVNSDYLFPTTLATRCYNHINLRTRCLSAI